MNTSTTRLVRTFIIVISSIIVLVMLVILLISPIAKYLVEKNDVKYTGRQIKTGWIYLNPFTGYVYIRHLKIYESESPSALEKADSVFFSAKGVSANLAMFKMLSKTIEITKLTLYQPKGIIIQSKKELNFNDLIKKFTPEKADSTSSRFHFNILGIKIENGEFHYREKVIPVTYYIKDVNFESNGKYWNADTIAVKFSLLSGTGSGSVKGNLTIDFKTLDFRLAALVHTFDLKFMEQYLKDIANYGTFSANLDADIKATGNLRDQENLTAKGRVEMNNFHVGRNPKDDYVSFDKLIVTIDEISPKKHLYLLDSMIISHPFLKYERYDYLDNLQRMFGKKGANISAAKADPDRFNLILKIGDYIKVIAKNFFKSDYKINKLAISNGVLNFNDYSLSEEFSTVGNPFNVVADSVNRNHNRVNGSFKSEIQPYGDISLALSINPKDSGEYDLQYHISSLPVTMFNPYLITYTSFPLDGGTIELNGLWKVREGVLNSVNHLLIIDPLVTGRLKNKDTKWIPTPLIMAFIRERSNVIDYEIPITGNLKDPKFHLSDVIFDILENIFIKPAAIPYITHVNNVENEIKQSLELQWEMRQNSLLPVQEKFMSKMVDFLVRNPEASIDIYPVQYAKKEMEYIRLFEAKKKYYLLSKDINHQFLSEDDSLKVEKMSAKDSLFVHFLNSRIINTQLFTIQEKCDNFIGSAFVNSKFNQLNKDREDNFMLLFAKNGVGNRVKINTGENTIPYNGFSFYKIVYQGELPQSLIKAYQQINDLNNRAPRKKLENEREKKISMR